MRDVVKRLATALGRKPPRFSIPVGPARAVAGILEDAMRLIGRRSPVGQATIDKYIEDIAVEGKRIQQELGFVPQYDLNAGWREIIREMMEENEFGKGRGQTLLRPSYPSSSRLRCGKRRAR